MKIYFKLKIYNPSSSNLISLLTPINLKLLLKPVSVGSLINADKIAQWSSQTYESAVIQQSSESYGIMVCNRRQTLWPAIKEWYLCNCQQ